MTDLEKRLRADGHAWRTQIDESVGRNLAPQYPHRRHVKERGWIPPLAVAAVVAVIGVGAIAVIKGFERVDSVNSANTSVSNAKVNLLKLGDASCAQAEHEITAGSVAMLSAHVLKFASAGPSIVSVRPTLTNMTSQPLSGLTGSVALVVVSLEGHIVATSPGSRLSAQHIDVAPGGTITLAGNLSLLDCRKALPPLVSGTDMKADPLPRATLSAGHYRVYGSVEIADTAGGGRRVVTGGPWTLVLS